MKSEKSLDSQKIGIRMIAAFEAFKGVLVVIVGIGLLALVHRDLQAIAEHLVEHLHFNPAGHYSQIFIEAATHVDDAKLRLFAAFAFLYATLRFIEAYGLWKLRTWAEWLAIVSGSIYLPIEIYELFKKTTLIRGSILLVNIIIVAYLIYVRWTNSHQVHEEV